jgi:hypothetical protein
MLTVGTSGNIDLTRILPFLGNTQLEVLSVVVSLLLLAGHLIMAIMVKERVLLKTESSGYAPPSDFPPARYLTLVPPQQTVWFKCLHSRAQGHLV